jgi:hypothetical protein
MMRVCGYKTMFASLTSPQRSSTTRFVLHLLIFGLRVPVIRYNMSETP